MSLIGVYGTPVPPQVVRVRSVLLRLRRAYHYMRGLSMILGRVSYPSVSVEHAASVLRIHPKTLYRNMAEIPHSRIGNYYRVHVSFLFLEYVPPTVVTRFDSTQDEGQLEFEYDVPIRTVRRYRNGDLRRTSDYDTNLSVNRTWRNPLP